MKRRAIVGLLLSTLACGKSGGRAVNASNTTSQIAAAKPSPPPLFEGLGTQTRRVTTNVPEAQRYFDQGLAFLYAFNHDEAIRAFTRASELDPTCAMAFWGIAMANGPHINNPAVDPDHAKAAWEALKNARERLSSSSPVEKALIEAAAARYAFTQPEDRKPLDQAFAEAMRGVAKAYPADADVGAIFGEALMNLRPWDFWTPEGKPQPGVEEIVATLESVLARTPTHPLANHLYIHAMEGSRHPEKADAAADRLRTMQPALGHMVHMPSHIDVRRGRWAQSITANERAIEADAAYRKQAPTPGFYTVYIAHNHHMLAYSAMMIGQSERAIRAIRAMIPAFPPETLEDPTMGAALDGYLAMPLEVLVRFGKWNEVLSEPEVKGAFPVYAALRHASRAVAHAAKGEVNAAESERAAFLEAKAKVGKESKFGNNPSLALLAVAEKFTAGEISARAGKLDVAIVELREAVKLEDALTYDEPPDWIIPVRHALGATLLKAKKAKEAEAVYREDLVRLPENGWSWLGLARSLGMQKRAADAKEANAHFERIWKEADITTSSSCFCQPGD